MENKRKGEGGGEGGGGGVGTGKESSKSMRTRLSKLLFGRLPLSFFQKSEGRNPPVNNLNIPPSIEGISMAIEGVQVEVSEGGSGGRETTTTS